MQRLNIRSETMLSAQHSWCVTMQNLLLQFQKMGHKLYLKSTDGDEPIPKELKSRLNRDIQIPDLDICYTLPNNFKSRFKPKAKLKMAIYNYETDILPSSWKSEIKYLDYVLPSSQFSKSIFLQGGWPEEKCRVIPHGINLEEFESPEKYLLKTQKSFKFLNISIPHYRKNIELLLEAYYTAFSGQDDVCLVLKTKLEPPKQRFEIDLREVIPRLQKRFAGKSGGLPQIEIIQERIPNIIPLYKSCHVLINTASSEGFGLPLLEGLAAGNLVLAPRCSGQLDFLNENNSLFLEVEEMKASEKYQYWKASENAKTYLPNLDSIVKQMHTAISSYDELKQKFAIETNRTIQEFTWKNAAHKILEIA